MNWIQKLFGKKKPETNRPFEDAIGISQIPESARAMGNPGRYKRNAKGRFVEGIGGLDLVDRDRITGKFISKKPEAIKGDSNISVTTTYKEIS